MGMSDPKDSSPQEQVRDHPRDGSPHVQGTLGMSPKEWVPPGATNPRDRGRGLSLFAVPRLVTPFPFKPSDEGANASGSSRVPARSSRGGSFDLP